MLDEAFFRQPTLTIARRLLGAHLLRQAPEGLLRARIVEVEAYHQNGDRAAHSHGGKTARNAVMFGPPGFLYVYFIYGMHHCMNVVTEPEGVGAAVLIRAVEPLEGQAIMRSRRGIPAARRARELGNGPAKCCQALAIGPCHNGAGLRGPDLWLERGEPAADNEVVSGPRIGISKSKELPWRFFIRDHPCVSKGKPA